MLWMQTQIPAQITSMTTMKQMILSIHSSMSSLYDQMDLMRQNSTAMGQAFRAKNDDSCQIPPQVFGTGRFSEPTPHF